MSKRKRGKARQAAKIRLGDAWLDPDINARPLFIGPMLSEVGALDEIEADQAAIRALLDAD